MIYVGISGWQYRDWYGSFYPQKIDKKSELYYISRKLSSIEINSTFYSLKNKEVFKHWYDSTPDGFIFSIKANGYITHVKKLNEIESSLKKFLSSGLENLEEKLGPVLWQFPPSMSYDPDKWEKFLKLLPKSCKEAKDNYKWKIRRKLKIRHAVEIRNVSFYNPFFIDQLRRHNITLVFSDNNKLWPYMEDITGDFIYLRLHGSKKIYSSNYSDSDLYFWKKRISIWSQGKSTATKYSLTINETKELRDVFIYFNNDEKGHAPINALNLSNMMKRDKHVQK